MIGEKDASGRQKHIAYRGKNLRVSRTGGVSLRHQAKLGRLNVTANSKHGVRISTRVAKNTQVALQNGRLVLRGRYGKGATRLNLSKSGVSVSTRTPIGSFNWIKPNRSSAKIAGVVVRGKKAAQLQMLYGIFMLLQLALMTAANLIMLAFSVLLWLGQQALTLPERLVSLHRKLTNQRLQRQLPVLRQVLHPPISEWTQEELVAGHWLLYTHITWDSVALFTQQHEDTLHTFPLLQEALPHCHKVANYLAPIVKNDPRQTTLATALIAQALARRSAATLRAETLLQVDEFVLTYQQRTEEQEQLLKVFADFAKLAFTLQAPADPMPTPAENTAAPQRSSALVNLNTASLQELETLPGIGPERALHIVALRPIQQVEVLTRITGIGPARLQAIIEHGVEL